MSKGNGAKADVWEFDWNGIKRKELRAMIADQEKAKEAEDDAAIFPWAAKVIKRWPYDLDPADPTSYEELGLADFVEVMKRFYATFPRVDEPVPAQDGG